ncbi:DUF3397 domain-containing protein [Planococcus shenhongbingii]|uniref:DUF3397 domain-containing protein n=1 Tax=Planococcus shenhongbingii TaxID=3058398 RepID=A0ABT8N8R3_9BACL|nr:MULTISPECIES: DUF3397 domain-containing protein [unclassified Planococcus (in: firmicutes)]MDN7244278.1 DUF3397 domain-containing protein [Planococcus sp. N017]WKA57447.1 DUF3397 domain-containing protein [Planococcus sp. N016]
MDIIYFIGAVVIFVPFILFVLAVLLTRKKLGLRSIGLAADLTTFLLFISVPLAVSVIWQIDLAFIIYIVAILIAISVLTIEWKKSKEIEIGKFFRKTWRIYFLVLSFTYVLLWIAGAAITISRFFGL